MIYENLFRNINNLKNENEKLFLHAPFIDGTETNTLTNQCIKKNQISAVGEYIEMFESKISELNSNLYAVSLSSGTAALHLALIASGVQPEDEVFVPSLTFSATANSVVYCGAHPHFLEIESDTLGIDGDKLIEYIELECFESNGFLFNKKTKRKISGIIGVYIFGNPFNVKKISLIAKKYSMFFIEDAAGALGSKFEKHTPGLLSDMAIFSFNGNKIISTGNGGAVISKDKVIVEKIRHLSTTAKIKNTFDYIHDSIGYNYRLSNINCAIGVGQLMNFPKILDYKKKIAMHYANLERDDLYEFFISKNQWESNNWLNTIFLNSRYLEVKYEMIDYFLKNGIEIRPAWKLLNDLEPYKNSPKMENPVAKDLQQRIINLPSGFGINF